MVEQPRFKIGSTVYVHHSNAEGLSAWRVSSVESDAEDPSGYTYGILRMKGLAPLTIPASLVTLEQQHHGDLDYEVCDGSLLHTREEAMELVFPSLEPREALDLKDPIFRIGDEVHIRPSALYVPKIRERVEEYGFDIRETYPVYGIELELRPGKKPAGYYCSLISEDGFINLHEDHLLPKNEEETG